MTKKFIMKKRALLLFAMMLLGGALVFSKPVELGIGDDYDPGTTIPSHGKSPITTPSVDLEGYELTFQCMHPAYAIDIVQNGIVIYSVDVDESTSSVMLPSWLSGEYEILLYPEDSDYYFYGLITL